MIKTKQEFPAAQSEPHRTDGGADLVGSRSTKAPSWHDLVTVHPATELFPPIPDEDLFELGENIKQNGLQQPIVLWTPQKRSEPQAKAKYLIDGRNRVVGMEAVGMKIIGENGEWLVATTVLYGETDPFEYVVSANLHRRHLTHGEKRELIQQLLKANPNRSDRETAKLAKVSDKTVGAVRHKMEATADIPQLGKTIGADGRERPARRSISQSRSKPKVSAAQRDIAVSGSSRRSATRRGSMGTRTFRTLQNYSPHPRGKIAAGMRCGSLTALSWSTFTTTDWKMVI